MALREKGHGGKVNHMAKHLEEGKEEKVKSD